MMLVGIMRMVKDRLMVLMEGTLFLQREWTLSDVLNENEMKRKRRY